MNANPRHTGSQAPLGNQISALPLELARQVDDLCWRFESAWKTVASAAEGPRLEAFLTAAPEVARGALLVGLVRVDIYHRCRLDETPYVEDYQTRFSELNPEEIALWIAAGVPAMPTKIRSERTPYQAPLEKQPAGQPGPAPARAVGPASRAGPVQLGSLDLPNLPGYEILEELGRGGMGVVYKARQLMANRVVALKMILARVHSSLEHKVRFKVEAELCARLHHPNIVQIHQVDEHDGLPFFSLEFCAGGPLNERLKGRSLPWRKSAELAETLARAVQHAHSRGVVHRDLKPANVLLTTEGEPKIADFGLAKWLDADSQISRQGQILGTPCYMSPEQASGEVNKIGPATDVYALGAILYEFLTGRPPFEGATWEKTLEQVRTQEPVAPGRLQPKVPRDLEIICLKCLHKESARRYASAGELADRLRMFLDGKPIPDRPVSSLERVGKWAKRRPPTLTPLGGGTLATISADLTADTNLNGTGLEDLVFATFTIALPDANGGVAICAICCVV